MDLTDYVILPGADYKDACDAVREKTGGTEGIKSGELGELIRGITPKLQEKAVHPGAEEQEVTPDEGMDGLAKVLVEAMLLQEKTVTPTTEAQEITADEGYDGLGKVTVGAAEETEPVLQSKTIDAILYNSATPDEGYDGLSDVMLSECSTNFQFTCSSFAVYYMNALGNIAYYNQSTMSNTFSLVTLKYVPIIVVSTSTSNSISNGSVRTVASLTGTTTTRVVVFVPKGSGTAIFS